MAAWKVFGAKGMEDAMDGEEKAIRLPRCLTAERHRSLSYSGGGNQVAEHPPQEGAGQASWL